MKAATFAGIKDVKVIDVAEPGLQTGTDAIIRVTTSAVCGSDLHLYNGRIAGVEPGTVVGHEYVGIVVDVGPQVLSVKSGDRVVGAFHTACGHCWFCRKGLYSQCSHTCLFGFGSRFGNLPGTQAEYARVPHADFTLQKVPDGISDEQALFAGDILATAYFAASRADIRPGDTVAVVGCGPVGLLCVMCALQAFGAGRVVAIDMVPDRLALAERLGAVPVNAQQEPVKKVKAMTGGRGADAVLEAVGSEATLKLAYSLVRGYGTISAAGVFTEDALPVPMGRAFARDITLRAGMANVPAHMGAVMELMAGGRVDPTVLISHRMALADTGLAYAMFDRKEALKIILRP